MQRRGIYTAAVHSAATRGAPLTGCQLPGVALRVRSCRYRLTLPAHRILVTRLLRYIHRVGKTICAAVTCAAAFGTRVLRFGCVAVSALSARRYEPGFLQVPARPCACTLCLSTAGQPRLLTGAGTGLGKGANDCGAPQSGAQTPQHQTANAQRSYRPGLDPSTPHSASCYTTFGYVLIRACAHMYSYGTPRAPPALPALQDQALKNCRVAATTNTTNSGPSRRLSSTTFVCTVTARMHDVFRTQRSSSAASRKTA